MSGKFIIPMLSILFGFCWAQGHEFQEMTEEIFLSDTTSLSSAPHDEVETPNFYTFNYRQLIVPGVLTGVGIIGIWEFSSIKDHIHNNWSVANGYKKLTFDNYLQYAPIPFYLGLGFIPGVRHRSDWQGRLMAGVSAYAVMTILTNTMKYSFRQKRPDSSSRNSFPSGHTATVFTGAELMRIEYGNWIGMTGYFVAGVVAALRIYNDRHWLNDVLAGAGIGILSARIGYWLLPWERKLFKLDRKNKKISIVCLPQMGYSNGFALSIDF